MPQSRIIVPLLIGSAGLRKRGKDREAVRQRVRFELLELDDINFAWWALACGVAYFPALLLAMAADAAGMAAFGWSSPTALGLFLVTAPLALAAWFLLRALATFGSGRVGAMDDIGVIAAVVGASIYAIVAG